MIKTLFRTSARVDEFVHIRIEDLLLDGDPPQIHIIHAKRGADCYVPILPTPADELRTHLHGRQTGFLYESNRHTRYSTRTVQSIVTTCAILETLCSSYNRHVGKVEEPFLSGP